MRNAPLSEEKSILIVRPYVSQMTHVVTKKATGGWRNWRWGTSTLVVQISPLSLKERGPQHSTVTEQRRKWGKDGLFLWRVLKKGLNTKYLYLKLSIIQILYSTSPGTTKQKAQNEVSEEKKNDWNWLNLLVVLQPSCTFPLFLIKLGTVSILLISNKMILTDLLMTDSRNKLLPRCSFVISLPWHESLIYVKRSRERWLPASALG